MRMPTEDELGFQGIADWAPNLMWRADETRARDWVNRAWLEFTGRALEEELGFGWTDALHPDDRDGCLEAYGKAFARGEPFSLTYRLRRADGSFRWILDNARPFKNEAGRLCGCLGASTDVDDMMRVSEALSQAVQERAEAVAQRDHLLREVQHRVRNNLQLILSIIDMQARAEPASRAALGVVAGRVRSISKAQALLLDPTGNAEINLVEYVPALTIGVGGPDRAITFTGPREPVLMPIGQAVPLGLMINEILSTLMSESHDGLHIMVFREAGETRIEIEMHGDGVLAHPSSKLVQRLSAQVGARVEQASEDPRKLVVRIDDSES
jgi:two-component system, sensor histidine kinase PdtaS